MALNPSRPGLSTACRALRQQCAPLTKPLSRQLAAPTPAAAAPLRHLSSSPARPLEAEHTADAANAEPPERPRWTYTPERLKGAGFSLYTPKDPRRSIWECNDDPKVLDAMYNRFLGAHGEKMLPDEIKWLAVTHKSFDQGRRGYNTRLAYLGASVVH